MTEFISKLSPLMEQFKKYRKASQRWSKDSHYKMRAFDRHCNELYPENDKLTQAMTDSFFAKRPTETINFCRQRCYLISEFIKYLQERELTNVIVPERPRKRRNTYIPHAFSHEELYKFFEACDNLRYLPNRTDMKIRSITAPVIFRLLYSTGIDYLYLYHDATLIPRLKETKTKVKGMSKNAVRALMSVPDATNKTGRRDFALIILLYATACRIDEVLSLKNRQLHLDAGKPYITVIGKGTKIRTIGLLPKAVSHLKKYLAEFHGESPDPEAYVFYSRNTGIYGKLTQPAVGKMLKKHAVCAHEICDEVPKDLHAHQIRHAKASHWLEDGMNIVQISLLLGHEHLQTTMVYLDITNDEKAAALATMDDENSEKITPKWKNADKSLLNLCGLS